jgi:ubiquinone/menaquinone biosynthesis C-methylase UbiE
VKNNYDKIAKSYDFLSKLVFGNSQKQAQINQLKYIKDFDRILIVGGGTGWIFDEISALNIKHLDITYVEISKEMILLSKKRNIIGAKVIFINDAVENCNFDQSFDIILTPFLFDNFLQDKVKVVFKLLNSNLKLNGKWFFVDFNLSSNLNSYWQKILLQLMYLFFAKIASVEADKLLDVKTYFKSDFLIIEERFYYGNFIVANVYEKIV